MPISRSQMERQLRMGGGIMGLEPRQQYGLGSFVKKAVKGVTGAVKSIAKSDLGKAALLAAGGYYMGGGFGPGGFKFGNLPGGNFFGKGSLNPLLRKVGGDYAQSSFGSLLTGGGIPGASAVSKFVGNNKGMIGATVLGGVLGALSPQEQEEISGSGGTNVEALRSKLTKAYTDLQYDPAKIPDLVANDLSEYTQDMNRTGAMYGGRMGYAEGSEDMILPMRKPKIEEMIYSNPGAAESGNPISRNNPVANLIDKYNTYKKAMPGVADETKTYLIEDFKKSLEDSGISIEEFNMRLQEQNEMDEPVDMAYGGRMGYSDGTDFENYLKGREQFEREQSEEQLYREYLEDKRRQKIAEQRNMAAYGGRMGYAFGTPEQNAIQAAQMEGLPLNQNPAGVTELDLRNSGGFIPPVGVKEKADDIPAMLSNNEFVFTADSVREFGDGDVNKGAQRMYDMMKKLENGGRV
jgi:hypothetical protein